MTNWIQITTADLEDYLVAAQLTALRERALGDSQDDPLPQIISDISARVRAEIASHPHNRLSSTPESIAPELKSAACYLIIESAQARIPYFGMTEEQIRQANDARSLLVRTARGEFALTVPSDPEENNTHATTGALSVERMRPNSLSGNQLKGL